MKWDEELIDGVVRVQVVPGRGLVPVLVILGRGDSLELRRPMVERLAAGAGRVVVVELRGQGGSGRLGAHRDAVHIDSFDQHLQDVEAVLDRLDQPAHLVAHSMGGLLAAHLLARHRDRFTSAAISSPMWRFVQPLPVARAVATVAVALGRGRHYASGEAPFDLDACITMRTSDLPGSATEALAAFAAARPELVRGGSTWGWVAAAARAMAALDRAPLESFEGPVVVASGRADRTVSLRAHHAVARRFPAGRVVELDSGHDPFFAADAERWWSEVEAPLAGCPA
jgi:lysophospholipase